MTSFNPVFSHSPHKDLDSSLRSHICKIEMFEMSEASFVFLGQMRTGLCLHQQVVTAVHLEHGIGGGSSLSRGCRVRVLALKGRGGCPARVWLQVRCATQKLAME